MYKLRCRSWNEYWMVAMGHIQKIGPSRGSNIEANELKINDLSSNNFGLHAKLLHEPFSKIQRKVRRN